MAWGGGARVYWINNLQNSKLFLSQLNNSATVIITPLLPGTSNTFQPLSFSALLNLLKNYSNILIPKNKNKTYRNIFCLENFFNRLSHFFPVGWGRKCVPGLGNRVLIFVLKSMNNKKHWLFYMICTLWEGWYDMQFGHSFWQLRLDSQEKKHRWLYLTYFSPIT